MENRFFLISFTFCFGDREFSLNLWGFSMSRLSMMKELCNVLKAFRTWVANKSEGDIMKENFTLAEFYLEIRRQHVFGWKRWCLKCSHVFQSLKHVVKMNKPCLDVKISRVDMRFCEFLWTLTERCQHAAFIRIFWCQGSDTSTRNKAASAETACLCAVKVAELWDRLT